MKINNLPNKIKIFDTVFRIKYVDRLMTDSGGYIRGTVHYISGEIEISLKDHKNCDRCETLIWRTLWHEIFHAVLDAIHRDYNTSSETSKEDLVCMLSSAVNTICFDNGISFKSENING